MSDNPGYEGDTAAAAAAAAPPPPPSYDESTRQYDNAASGGGATQYGQQPYPQPYDPNSKANPPVQHQPQGQQYMQYGQQPYPQPYQPQYGYPPPGAPAGGVTVVQPSPISGGVLVLTPEPHYFVKSYIVLACLTFWCVNPLFGCMAMIFSFMSMSARDGRNYDEARKWGRVALYLSIVGMIITAILVTVLIIIIAIDD